MHTGNPQYRESGAHLEREKVKCRGEPLFPDAPVFDHRCSLIDLLHQFDNDIEP